MVFLLLRSYSKLAPFGNFKNKPARIPPQTPPPREQNPKNKLVSVLRKSISPENSFRKTESELKPRHLPEYLEGRTPKRKMSFPFRKNPPPAKIKRARNIFSFWGCRVKRGGGGAFVGRTI